MQLKSVPLNEDADAEKAPEVEESFFSMPAKAPGAEQGAAPDVEEDDDYVPRVTMHNGARFGIIGAVGLGVVVAVIAIVANRAQSPTTGATSGPTLPDVSAYRTEEPVAEAQPEPPPPVPEPVVEEPAAEAPQPAAAATPAVSADGKVPPLPEVDPKAKKDHIQQAFALFNAGKFAAAEKEALLATRARPTRADAWLVLGAARDALGDHAGAISAYRTCGVRARGPAARDCHRLAQGL